MFCLFVFLEREEGAGGQKITDVYVRDDSKTLSFLQLIIINIFEIYFRMLIAANCFSLIHVA